MTQAEPKYPHIEPLEKVLRQARRARGLSLEDVARDTKVRKIHLKQFETHISENLDVYQKGYLGLYGRYLDVDVQAHMNAIKAKASQPQPQRGRKLANASGKKIEGSEAKPSSPRFSRRYFLLGGALVVALAVAAIIGKHTSIKHRWTNLWSAKHEETVQSSEQHVLTSEAEQTEVGAVVPTPSASAAEQINRQTYIITGVHNPNFDIKITASKPTAFTITGQDSNKVLVKGQLKAGEMLKLPQVESSRAAAITIKTTVPDALDIQLARDSNVSNISTSASTTNQPLNNSLKQNETN